MPTIYPTNWQQLRHLHEHRNEYATLLLLHQQLPADFVVVHGAHWTRLNRHYATTFEVDFCIVAPSGELVVIEQKNGALNESTGVLCKQYRNKQKNVTSQILQAVEGLQNRYNKLHAIDKGLMVDYLLYCPDYTVQDLNSSGLIPERIVDRPKAKQLIPLLKAMVHRPADPDQKKRVVDFLTGYFNLSLDIGSSLRLQESAFTYFADELSYFVQSLQFSPWWLRIQGSAGSGKTQLASTLFSQAAASGKKTLYLCFNRPLADRFRALFPHTGRVETRDSLADQFLRSQGHQPTYLAKDPENFLRIREQAKITPVPANWQFDTVIIDEGQDFETSDLEFFRHFFHDQTQVLWLEDPRQNIYLKIPAEIPATITLTTHRDYRSPFDVLNFTQNLLYLDPPLIPMNPVPGLCPQIYPIQTPEEELQTLINAITQALSLKIKLSEIVILSLSGKKNSLLNTLDKIGQWSLSKFTGEYTPQGTQIWTQGQLVFDTIYRFKGQQAPWIIVIDIHGEWTERLVRSLYCALTRATYSATLLIHTDTIEDQERHPGKPLP